MADGTPLNIGPLATKVNDSASEAYGSETYTAPIGAMIMITGGLMAMSSGIPDCGKPAKYVIIVD